MAGSEVLEGYCADIEHLLREGSLREAVRLAVALPEICASLESPRLRSSHEDYVRWCQRWLVAAARAWYEHARHDGTVVKNLGKLALR